MGRVSQDTIQKLKIHIENLPEDLKGKCALCNETLTHIVKTAEVETSAGTATVTKELAEEINKSAAAGDQISGEQLRDRVRRQEGKDDIRANRPDKPTGITKDPGQNEKKPTKKALLQQAARMVLDGAEPSEACRATGMHPADVNNAFHILKEQLLTEYRQQASRAIQSAIDAIMDFPTGFNDDRKRRCMNEMHCELLKTAKAAF